MNTSNPTPGSSSPNIPDPSSGNSATKIPNPCTTNTTSPKMPVSGKRRFLIAGTSVFFVMAGLIAAYLLLWNPTAEVERTDIPKEAWSRDIGAKGYLDGAPIGGLGAGALTWRYDGNFYDGRLNIGKNDMDVDKNCGFYMYQKPDGGTGEMKRLDAETLGEGQAAYYSLFPKSWVDYYGDQFTCKAKVTQFSPIIPGDYKLSSYPVGLYQWEISNPSEKSCEVSIMFSWENTYGGKAVVPAGDREGKFAGITLQNVPAGGKPKKGTAEFSIGSEVRKDLKLTYAASADVKGLTEDLAEDGLLGDTVGSGDTGAVCISAKLKPGQVLRFPMVLAWDMPIAEGFRQSDWYREYTRHFGREGTNSWKIAQEALTSAREWEDLIDDWQESILNSTQYPDWLKTTLFNELYYYVVGGTIWEAGAASGQPDDPDEDMFGSMECYEFPYYGTSDVRFYGSWALVQLWPELDKQCVRQFCDSVYTTREDRPRPLGTTAHDFGQIGSAFRSWNAYNFRNSKIWKDLNTKLVLMVYRDWMLTGKKDAEFLEYCWTPVKKAMEVVKSQDADGDGLPDSIGIDQTYDNMSLIGDTAYCGGLFLAACEAAEEMATVMGEKELADTYQSWLHLGQKSFEKDLWNGSYYNIDTSSPNTSRIMSDQLCGQWYAAACGLPGIVPDGNAASAFQKIYEYNFKKFDNGTHGVVNVMLPNGEIDSDNSQSPECWVGTSWGVVAGMIQQGMTEQAEEIGKSLYDTVWNSGQLWFRTPEAWQSGLTPIRSPYYMRATAVWAVKHAYDLKSMENQQGASAP